jgi:predicted dithiol-disulfide oxidoreductase (DUF899 family)
MVSWPDDANHRRSDSARAHLICRLFWARRVAFFRDGDRVYRTYFINWRGHEAIGTLWSYLDMRARASGGMGGLA